MNKLDKKKCQACTSNTPPLIESVVQEFLTQLHEDWKLKEKKLYRVFQFKNFANALDFLNKVGRLAEEEGHHPDMFITWGRVEIELWTHKIQGLSENDFILAAKIDKLTS